MSVSSLARTPQAFAVTLRTAAKEGGWVGCHEAVHSTHLVAPQLASPQLNSHSLDVLSRCLQERLFSEFAMREEHF